MGLYRDKSKIKLGVKNTYDTEYWKAPNLVNSYIAGAIAGDGCIFLNKHKTNVFSYKVAIKDECIIDLLKLELKCNSKKNYTQSKSPHSDNISYLVSFVIASFDTGAKYLKEHYNIVPNKTFRLGPTNLVDNNLNLAYLVGLIDSDGSVEMAMKQNGKRYLYISFNSASKELIKWIKEIIDKNVAWRVREANVRRQDNCYKIYIGGRRAAILFEILSSFNLPSLARKWKRPEVLAYVARQKEKYPHLFDLKACNNV